MENWYLIFGHILFKILILQDYGLFILSLYPFILASLLEKYMITPREKEIIELVLAGDNNKAIGMAVKSRVQLAQMIYNNNEKW